MGRPDDRTPSLTPAEIGQLRERIEAVSCALVQALDERFELSTEMGRVKIAQGFPFRDPERERLLIDRMISASDGRCPPELIRAVFRLVLDASVERMERDKATSEGKE